MIVKNTPSNRSLVRKMSNITNSFIDFRALSDYTWNCKADIRFEITTIGMDAPFIVCTDLDENEHLKVTTRLLVKELNAYETMRLGNLLLDLDALTAKLEQLIEDYIPNSRTA